MKTQLDQIIPNLLKPHPRNSSIYGDDEDVTELVELIRRSGWVKPVIVTANYVIISGHRRWKAALQLELDSVPVEIREFTDEIGELEALLLENASRFKTNEQKVREAHAWKEIETLQAKGRISEAGQKGAPGRPGEKGCENFRTLSQGRAVDHLAKRVNLGSGRTYEKAAHVVGVIDEHIKDGDLITAQGLRKILNEQSVDAAHTLAKKPPPERQAITELIVKGIAKSTRQAAKILNQNNEADSKSADSSDPYQPSFAGFSIGDWVEISEQAHAHNLTYIGQRGRVDQILAPDKQISVSFEGMTDKIRFEPSELCLLVRSAPQTPVRVGDIVFVRIERHEAASPEQKKWNGFWGQVAQIGEMGSLKVDVGSESLQLFPRDVQPVDAPSTELRHFVERVLHLRRLELDEAEVGLLDLFQRREWLTPRQLDYLQIIEKFHVYTDSHQTELHQVVQFRGR